MEKNLSITPVFEFGTIVYLVTDPDQKEYMITGFLIRPGRIVYYITHSVDEHQAYEFELSHERDKLKTLL